MAKSIHFYVEITAETDDEIEAAYDELIDYAINMSNNGEPSILVFNKSEGEVPEDGSIPINDVDPDAHLVGTPWDNWRINVADLLCITPADVSRRPGAYEAFNTLVSEADYVGYDDAE